VLSHFGAPAEVLTDQGTEFQGEFQVLCDKALIGTEPRLEIIQRQMV
jgi:hypothetical protein